MKMGDIDVPKLNTTQVRTPLAPNSPNLTDCNSKKTGIPPISPYSQIPVPKPMNYGRVSTHSRSLSQPSCLNSDSLPPLGKNCNSNGNCNGSDGSNGNYLHMTNDGFHTSKVHRRSMSDVPFGLVKEVSLGKFHDGSIEGGEIVDDLVSMYMNLDDVDTMNKKDEIDSHASGSRTNGCVSSENESESSMNDSISSGYERNEDVKRKVMGEVGSHSKHYRSLSLDGFVGKVNVGAESLKLPPLSVNGGENGLSLYAGIGGFTSDELSKIMVNEKLVEIASTNPKRVKRILANRKSAARSKERKVKYISELEHKVQTLQSEATIISAKLTLLQRDSVELTTQNNELKFCLQAMEQQALLHDALNEALRTEIQRLKIASGELTSTGVPDPKAPTGSVRPVPVPPNRSKK